MPKNVKKLHMAGSSLQLNVIKLRIIVTLWFLKKRITDKFVDRIP
ncbi:hypothetical protein KsCSTR_31920 [Candidatus Kuenenia stuttgartiensis]|uniref:Uncharacterized protein n=1 Tax=Kuenenia stuttgartiensis TaxID=174633 RepID=A0A6G7GSZ6_KUEST|nr:hypothetical protein KsCSTR_31920 [Candidatus Kuenenia stuttgartiensis]